MRSGLFFQVPEAAGRTHAEQGSRLPRDAVERARRRLAEPVVPRR